MKETQMPPVHAMNLVASSGNALYGLGYWLHPIVIAFNTLCPVEFYVQWCGVLHQIHWGSFFEKSICPCHGS